MTVREYVTMVLERFPEAREDRFELVRQVYHMNAKRADVTALQVDAAVNVLQKFRSIRLGIDDVLREQRNVQNKERPDLQSPKVAEQRAARAESFREHYSPIDDEDQTKLF